MSQVDADSNELPNDSILIFNSREGYPAPLEGGTGAPGRNFTDI